MENASMRDKISRVKRNEDSGAYAHEERLTLKGNGGRSRLLYALTPEEEESCQLKREYKQKKTAYESGLNS